VFENYSPNHQQRASGSRNNFFQRILAGPGRTANRVEETEMFSIWSAPYFATWRFSSALNLFGFAAQAMWSVGDADGCSERQIKSLRARVLEFLQELALLPPLMM